MFKQPITSGGVLFDYDLENFFTQIRINNFVPISFDDSLMATLRIMTRNRIPEGKILHVDASLPSDEFLASSENIEIFVLKEDQPKLSVIDFLEKHEDWEENVSIREFVKEYAEIYVLQHKTKPQVIGFFPDNHALECFHLFQAFLPKYLPSLFQEHPLTTEELKFLTTLTKPVSNFYLKAVSEAENLFDFSEYMQKLIMEKIFKKMRDKKIKEANRAWELAKDDMMKAFERYKEYCDLLQKATEKKEMAILQRDDHQELVDYLSIRKDVKLIGDDVNGFKIAVYTTLDLFDSDLYERMKENLSVLVLNKILYSNVAKESFLRFTDHCFSENADCKIHIQGAYQINLNGSAYACTCKNQSWENKNIGFNPHLEQHRCSGNYGPMVNDFCISGDFIGAIEQITASVKSINFAEVSATVVPFLVDTYNDNRPCIEMANGELMTMKEAIAFLDKEDTHETNQDE